ncbi:hypothetical protein EVAR_97393_1 [Eumeta japonica]|uniref:Uncharacterized protein n=1 Tax=Eumeta variegata TaxID=151549 RepID=A0A4C1SQC1_EUMVA|nr:hypothetical protein EVAR_97393_1 [Eumeta japonica]
MVPRFMFLTSGRRRTRSCILCTSARAKRVVFPAAATPEFRGASVSRTSYLGRAAAATPISLTIRNITYQYQLLHYIIVEIEHASCDLVDTH